MTVPVKLFCGLRFYKQNIVSKDMLNCYRLNIYDKRTLTIAVVWHEYNHFVFYSRVIFFCDKDFIKWFLFRTNTSSTTDDYMNTGKLIISQSHTMSRVSCNITSWSPGTTHYPMYNSKNIKSSQIYKSSTIFKLILIH